MDTLRLVQIGEGDGYRVDLTLASAAGAQSATAQFVWELGAQDREDLRWYLEDYLLYPIDPAPAIAARVEARIAEIGRELFVKVFEANRDTMRLWDQVADRLPEVRVEVLATVEEATAVPWELLCDPATDAVVALRAAAFVRTDPYGPQAPLVAGVGDVVRVLLVICRPGGAEDVPFRSVASHLVRLSRSAREAFQLDVLRPATFARLAQVLEAAKRRGEPYHLVHFDGHGAYLDHAQLVAAAGGGLGVDPLRFSVLSEVREGSHGYLLFEDPQTKENYQLVDGPALGRLLFETGVAVLVLNACRSAHADLIPQPQIEADNIDVHARVRAYGSLAQEVIHAGVGGVVAMGYNVWVVTAAQFVGDLYAALAEGQPLGQAVTAGRRRLAVRPEREVALERRRLRDWMVPIVYETAPTPLLTTRPASGLTIRLSQAEAAAERAWVDPSLPADPDVGFYGRDETLLALDRAFDTESIVLLWAWAGAGKTSTAAEFARWYQLTGGLRYDSGEGRVLSTTFTRHTPLTRVLDDLGAAFGPALQAVGVHWQALNDDAERRGLALQVLDQVPVLWIWDNVEPVAGFPTGTPSMWTDAEQAELVDFLRDLRATRARVLVTSRRDERGWLGELPARIKLPVMPMAERVQLARAIAGKHDRRLADVADWRSLLEFTAGNPLTVTVLVGQALRANLTTKEQMEVFVDQLRVGAAEISDDAQQGRDRSLAASLGYGLDHAFMEQERGQLALLALFQGFVDVAVLCFMGDPDAEWCVSQVRGMSREQWIGLLDRTAEVGLLSARGNGCYSVHPALPWFFRQLFTYHYGPPDQQPAKRAVRAYVVAIGGLGDYYRGEYEKGWAEVVGVLVAQEANLLHARRLARAHGWWWQAIDAMQGLRHLYGHTGRTGEWRRLVEELISDLVDPVTGGPLPGREGPWSLLTEYRVHLAWDGRDWDTAQRLQQPLVDWRRQRAAVALASPVETLDDDQRKLVHTLAVSVELLGRILLGQGHPGCVQHFEEAVGLFGRIGARQGEADAALSLANAYIEDCAQRDLDQAQAWLETSLGLRGPDDRLGRAVCVGSLGRVALERSRDASAGGASSEELMGHLAAAVAASEQALGLLPNDAVAYRAAFHNQLGIIYARVGALDTALVHYREAIRNQELRDNRYEAGRHGSMSPSPFAALVGCEMRCCTPKPPFVISNRPASVLASKWTTRAGLSPISSKTWPAARGRTDEPGADAVCVQDRGVRPAGRLRAHYGCRAGLHPTRKHEGCLQDGVSDLCQPAHPPLPGRLIVAEPTPLEDLVVNDRYWLARGREMVTASICGRDEAATRLGAAIGWFWTVYTTAALAGVALTDRAIPLALAGLLALPPLLLIVAYAGVLWTLTPIGIIFDPRVPVEIANIHTQASLTKHRRLKLATACTLLAALAATIGIIATALTKPPIPPALHTALAPNADNTATLLVRGRFSPDQKITLSVTPDIGQTHAQPPVLAVTAADGTLREAIPVVVAPTYTVTAAWTDNTGRWTLTTTLNTNPSH